MQSSADIKKCFIITPIGPKRSKIREKARGIIDNVLTPALKAHSYEIVNPMDSEEPGSITSQIINNIVDAKLVVANITGLNANVMYELAIRHATNKPTIIIAEEGTKAPFDIYNDRIMFYEDIIGGAKEFINRFEAAIILTQLEETVDNPISRAIEGAILRKKARTTIEKHLLRNSDITVSYLSRIAFEIGLDQNSPGIGMQIEYKIKPRSSNDFSKLMANIHGTFPMNVISIEHSTYSNQKADGHLFFRYKGWGNTQEGILQKIKEFGLIIVKAYIIDDNTSERKLIRHY